jgi:mRNA interferase RelE/StbE
MRYEIVLSPEAVEDLRSLAAHDRAAVREAMEAHLRTAESRSGTRRLRGVARPQYRLRVGEVRVFYDVGAAKVEVIAIVPKPGAQEWLREQGDPE